MLDQCEGEFLGASVVVVSVLQYVKIGRDSLRWVAENSKLIRIQLFSYPLEDLNAMLFEERFLKELGESMIIYYFGPEKRISEKIIMEENSEQSNNDIEPRKHGSLYNPTSKDLIEIQGRIKKIVEEEKNNEKPKPPPLFDKHSQTAKHPRL